VNRPSKRTVCSHPQCHGKTYPPVSTLGQANIDQQGATGQPHKPVQPRPPPRGRTITRGAAIPSLVPAKSSTPRTTDPLYRPAITQSVLSSPDASTAASKVTNGPEIRSSPRSVPVEALDAAHDVRCRLQTQDSMPGGSELPGYLVVGYRDAPP
jgi:hypothetical protein